MKRALVLCLSVALLGTACSSSSGGNRGAGGTSEATSTTSGGASSVSGKITVLAASSLTESFDTIATQFKAIHPGVDITFNFGASSDLATEISNGNPGDVFASASTTTMTQVGDAAVHPADFATNTMEIAVAPGNPKGIRTVADLAKSGTKVAVCDFAVPCGVVAKAVFDNAKTNVQPVAREQDVKSTLAVVENGEVDAGIVYVTDVKAAGNQVEGVEIPADINATTTYPISALKDSKNQALAQAFVDYVLSPAGQRVLHDDAFAPA